MLAALALLPQSSVKHLCGVLTASPNSRLIPASRGAGIDPVPFAGIAANNLEIALFRELRTLNRR